MQHQRKLKFWASSGVTLLGGWFAACVSSQVPSEKNLPLFARNWNLCPLFYIQAQAASGSLPILLVLIFLQHDCAFVSTATGDDKQARTHHRFQKTPRKTSQGFTLGFSLPGEGTMGQPQPWAPPWGQVGSVALLWHLGQGWQCQRSSGLWAGWGNPGEGGQDPLVASGPCWVCWNDDLRQAITQLAGGNFKPWDVLTRCCKLI